MRCFHELIHENHSHLMQKQIYAFLNLDIKISHNIIIICRFFIKNLTTLVLQEPYQSDMVPFVDINDTKNGLLELFR